MVTPTYGTAMFRGASGKTYAVDFYIADVVGSSVKFDNGSGASSTSLSFWRCPENVLLYDISLATGPTVMTTMFPTANGAQIGNFRFRIANFLNTLATRPALAIGFRGDTNFGMTEA